MPVTNYHDFAENDSCMRFAGRIPFQMATSYAYFTDEGLLQHLMHGLKYQKKTNIGTYLGKCLGESLQQTSWASSLDLIIPVPLHRKKKWKRGYNQSLLIGQGIASVLGVPCRDDLLLRTRNTESQTKKTRTERIANMKGAFDIKQSSMLAGKHILLCDDVLTTGATIEACALALLDKESVKISVATIGIAVS